LSIATVSRRSRVGQVIESTHPEWETHRVALEGVAVHLHPAPELDQQQHPCQQHDAGGVEDLPLRVVGLEELDRGQHDQHDEHDGLDGGEDRHPAHLAVVDAGPLAEDAGFFFQVVDGLPVCECFSDVVVECVHDSSPSSIFRNCSRALSI
jgi:hypothetical protein